MKNTSAPALARQMSTNDSSLESLLDQALQTLPALDQAIVAFSGGVDSSLVLDLCMRTYGASRVRAVTAVGPAVAQRDLGEARAIAEHLGVTHETIETRELARPGYRSNAGDRCYHCKTELYSVLTAVANHAYNHHDQEQHVLFNGTNKDDLADHRPGLVAAKEFKVRSPLAEGGLNKAEVRALARFVGLPNWNRPAAPCLASRIAYFEPVTQERLERIEAAEDFLKSQGFDDVRVRHLPGTIASIEVPEADIASLHRAIDRVRSHLGQLGFAETKIDPEGLVSGKLNRALEGRSP